MSDEYKPIGPLIDEVDALRTQLHAAEERERRTAVELAELKHIAHELVTDWEAGPRRVNAFNDSLHELRAALRETPATEGATACMCCATGCQDGCRCKPMSPAPVKP